MTRRIVFGLTNASSLIWMVISPCLCLQCLLWGFSYQRNNWSIDDGEQSRPESCIVRPSKEDHQRRRENILRSGPSSPSFPNSSPTNTRGPSAEEIMARVHAQAWIHPPLLAHPNPQHVALIWTMDDEETRTATISLKANLSSDDHAEIYIQQATEHNLVRYLTLIQIVNGDDGPPSSPLLHIEDSLSVRHGVQIRRRTISTSSVGQVDHWLRKAVDNVPPVHLVLINARISRELSASARYLSSLSETFKSRRHQNQDDDDDDDDETYLTVVLELSGGNTRTAQQRHFIAKVLDTHDEENDDIWEFMRDYTLRLPTPKTMSSTRLQYRQLRNYVILFGDSEAQARWHFNEAEWNRRLHVRLRMDEKWNDNDFDDPGNIVLDSALLLPLEYAAKQSEIDFCQSFAPEWDECHPGGGTGVDLNKSNVRASKLVVQKSQQGNYAGRGLFTTIDILPNTLIGADQSLVYLQWPSTKILTDFERHRTTNAIYEKLVDPLYSYFDGYGVIYEWQGMPFYVVDSTGLAFVNHGCHGAANVGLVSNHHESNLQIPDTQMFLEQTKQDDATGSYDSWLYSLIPEDYLSAEAEEDFYKGIRRPTHRVLTETKQFIPAGTEILDNYLSFGGMQAPAFWEYVGKLQRECSGLPGDIELWERGLDNDHKTHDTLLSSTQCLDHTCNDEL